MHDGFFIDGYIFDVMIGFADLLINKYPNEPFIYPKEIFIPKVFRKPQQYEFIQIFI